MIHFIPESPADAMPAPYAEAVARLASIRQALACVESVAGKPISDRDSEARLALAFPGAPATVQRCFADRSARVAGGAAAGLQLVAKHHDDGTVVNPAAMDRLALELQRGLDDLDQLFSL